MPPRKPRPSEPAAAPAPSPAEAPALPAATSPAVRSYGAVHLFPVRHHSPRTSFVLRRWLDALRPRLVLVEGPEDATPLIDILVDQETTPPVAILGYRADGTPGSSLWPFASYSPELVALRWAREHGATARFIDISTGQSLARGEEGPAGPEDMPDVAPAEAMDDEPDEAPPEGSPAAEEPLRERVARERGFRSFEELWEACFEAPDHGEKGFREALMAFAELVRHEGAEVSFHRARDAFMARRIDEAVVAGTPPEHIAVVLGAAHAAALAVADVDETLLAQLLPTVPTATTVIPFSFPRLAEQTGYGAGNRAPQFYQRAWDQGLSFRRAALEVLVDFCDHLRLRGFMASLADTIEAYRLACMLSDLRGKSDPGLDEIREATVATLCRGDATHVDSFLWPSVIGRQVGRVASRIGKNSLQEEFWRELAARRLPATDERTEFTLKLGDPVQVGTSVFLHRLRIAQIPYAGFGGTRGATARPGSAVEEAGGVAALSRVREDWAAGWTPATDVALVEKIVLGETLSRVCERLLSEALAAAKTTAEAAQILLESVVTSVPETLSTALAACDRLAADDDDLPSLARACRALSGLVAYGTSRAHADLGTGALPPLCRKTYDRAVLRVPAACTGNDEAVAPAKEALRILHELAMSQSDSTGALLDRQSWLEAARGLLHDETVHPSCSGVAGGLLYLAGQLSDQEAALLVGRRVSDTTQPARGADFLAGFLEVNALVLVKNRQVVATLDSFLCGIDPERFRDVLPVLRRAFQPLGATERRYLVENLVALRKLGGQAAEVAQVMAERDKEKLAAMSEEISKAMDDLDDLL